jgi:threonine/homoserine/homoserine lactone efflux protein
MGLLLEGVATGFSIAAPVGPIGVLCIRRTLAGGRAAGLAAGLGAALADAACGRVAGFGLTSVSSFLLSRRPWLQLLGGAFLCWLGARTFFRAPAARPAGAAAGPRGLAGAFGSTSCSPSRTP